MRRQCLKCLGVQPLRSHDPPSGSARRVYATSLARSAVEHDQGYAGCADQQRAPNHPSSAAMQCRTAHNPMEHTFAVDKHYMQASASAYCFSAWRLLVPMGSSVHHLSCCYVLTVCQIAQRSSHK
jgi:hypothetical protein